MLQAVHCTPPDEPGLGRLEPKRPLNAKVVTARQYSLTGCAPQECYEEARQA